MGEDKIKWHDATGAPLTCHEKLKVLQESLSDLQTLAEDVLEEALILQVDEAQIRQVMTKLMEQLKNPYA